MERKKPKQTKRKYEKMKNKKIWKNNKHLDNRLYRICKWSESLCVCITFLPYKFRLAVCAGNPGDSWENPGEGIHKLEDPITYQFGPPHEEKSNWKHCNISIPRNSLFWKRPVYTHPGQRAKSETSSNCTDSLILNINN